MKEFEFSEKVLVRVINEMRDAEKYIRIAIFQIHNPEIFHVLNEKLQDKIAVEIFTLPIDSINLDVQAEVAGMLGDLQLGGA